MRKDTWIHKLLKERQTLFTKEIGKILICYGVYQPIYGTIAEEMPDVALSENCNEEILRSNSILDPSLNSILIIDDLHAELANNPLLSKLFCKFSHHLNCVVIFLTQNLYHRGSQMRDVITNAHYIICMAQPRDKTAIQTISRQMFPGRSSFLVNAFEQATSRPYEYLLIDARPETHSKFRVRGGLFADETDHIWVPIGL